MDQLNSGESVHQWPGRLGFNPRSSYTKDSKKWCLMLPCLISSIIRYLSRVKWSNQRKGVAASLSVVAIEKGAFESPTTTVANFTFLYNVTEADQAMVGICCGWWYCDSWCTDILCIASLLMWFKRSAQRNVQHRLISSLCFTSLNWVITLQ